MPEHTIAENLTRLQNATTAIGNAITSKGGTVTSGDGLEDFASDIATIPSGGGSEYNGKFVSGTNFESVAKSLTEIIIPQGTILLENRAFNMCTNLVNVDLNDVKTLDSSCFRWCSSLSSIDLKSVEEIKDRVFESSGITSIEIPNSVTSINQNAFTDSSINTITVHKPEGSISGAPWGATNATVIWDG